MLLALLALLAFNDVVFVAPGRLAPAPIWAPQEHSRRVSAPCAQRGMLLRELDPGRYALLPDNRVGRSYTSEVWRGFHFDSLDAPAPGAPRELPPGRRAAIVVVSLLFLIGISAYAGRRIRRSWPKR